ncbi:histone-lysine N-methyltransferase NSD2-like isoform X2 [Liolophura sinensis]|uniref:histone-lysine N-methyltransferase NSD2-like isoform X2 n=1 Tax=Liolophura sinensis TaxID=3198878 RepID=UPI0031592157
MDAESPSQGSDNGDADPPKPATGPKVTPGFRHHLPQIPMMNVGHKIAQSKASAKQDVNRALSDNQSSETTKLHIEGTGKIVEISGSGRQEEIFTPPETESSSNSSPGDAKPQAKNGSTKDKYGDMTGTPIKLRIRRANRDGELDLSSCVDEAPQNNSVVDNSFSESGACDLNTDSPGQLNISSSTPGAHRRRGKSKKGRYRGSAVGCPAVTTLLKPKTSDKSPKWVVGDLVWSKVTGHPWWPCMISPDPFEGIYTKLRQGKNLSYRLYHVQFFGNEGERGWVTETGTLPFEGKRQLEDYFKAMQMRVTHKQRAQYKLDVSARRRHAWEIAYKNAEEALPLSNSERKQKYTYVYELGPSKGISDDLEPTVNKASEEDTGTGRTKTKAKLKKALITARTSRLQGNSGTGSATPTSEEGLNGDSTSKKGRKRKQPQYAESDSEDDHDDEPSPRRKRKKLDTSVSGDGEGSAKKSHRTQKADGSFDVFCEKHRDNVLSDHPEFDDKTLTEYLQQQWEMMDSKQRSRYRCKFAARPERSSEEAEQPIKDGNSTKRSGRVIKPSQKKLEAEEIKKLSSPGKKTPNASSEHTKERTDLPPSSPQSSDTPKRLSPRASPEPEASDGRSSADQAKKSKGNAQPKPEAKKRRQSKKTAQTTETDSDSGVETLMESSVLPPMEDGEERPLAISRLSSAYPNKKENVCWKCEKGDNLVSCEGPCGGSFHTDCLGLEHASSSPVKCTECTSGIHSCFSCKTSSGDIERCAAPHCGRFYHEDCVKGLLFTRTESKGFICPLHVCATCATDHPKSIKASKGRMFRCVRCPVAYHVGDFCIAAGSKHLPGCNIICSKHFKPVKKGQVKRGRSHHTHVNVSWCFVCNNGGTLLCCESCPAAFHEECLRIQRPEGSWYCSDCTSGKRPLYGDIIWIKLGNYRWWPGEICHPRNVPKNIQELKHQVGQFPVRFFGSDEYYWIHQGRVFLFQEGDKSSKESSGNKNLAVVFRKAIVQGIKAFRIWKAAKENKAQQDVEKNEKKPAPFKLIKVNAPYGNVQIYKPDLAELPRCECRPDQDSPCGPDSECVNRMLMYECHPAVCPAGEKCMNQRFQKREYPKSTPFRTAGRGWGLKTLVDIKKGQFVNEYVGELVDEEECRRRIVKAHEENITNFYMLTIDKNRIIDAGPKGNLSRFMNHSCQPNLETQKWTINGEVRVGLFAAQDIPAESELTFNYNLDCLGNEKTVCACGAPICSGFLGVRPKTSAAAANEKRAKETKKRKKKKPKTDVKKEHDDDCFRCGEGGELVMCDKSACPKAYHLQCLNLAKPPHGKWVCPWHHCDDCGKPSSQLCSECPNSFCKSHLDGKIFATEDEKLICWEHEDLLSKITVTKVDPLGVKDHMEADQASVNGESTVTDSDSQMSAEESEKSSTENPTSERTSLPSESASEKQAAVGKVSRTGRRIKRPSLDVLEVNGLNDEKKTKQLKGKKRTVKTKVTVANVSQSAAKKSKDVQHGVVENPNIAAVKDRPMFDDSDEEGFGGLVIDIPTV